MSNYIGLILIVQLMFIILVVLFKRFSAPAAQTYDGTNVEQTTKLPLNFAAQTCHHDWEQLSKENLEGMFERKFVLILKCKGCGTIDKTIETVQPTCKHDWSSTEVTVKSAHEQMATSSYYTPQKPGPDNAWVWGKQNVLVRTCRRCGETHETKVENTAFALKPPATV
jgi:hypothetical protein